ncbi:MAG: hypothetical protein GY859_30965 [Desulfobacterales bacterium]|nr:hypothetical protein [Desulfobacterales bacterium]
MVFLFFAAAGVATAGDKKDMGGWEKDSPYNQLYDASERDSFKGRVVAVKEVVPMPGMSPAVALVVKESETDSILVHVCPVWWADSRSIGVKKGDKVKVKGVWAEIDGEDVFMASKVKRGDYFEFKVRLTKNGLPFWAMTPEELEKEKKKK